jgi:hypothetical protein
LLIMNSVAVTKKEKNEDPESLAEIIETYSDDDEEDTQD